jgi:hypothetical protein
MKEILGSSGLKFAFQDLDIQAMGIGHLWEKDRLCIK